MAAGQGDRQTHTLSTAARLCAASLGTNCALLDDTFLTIETFTGGDKRVGTLCEQVKAAPEGAASCAAARQAGAVRVMQLGGAYFYECHAELVEAIVPVQRDGAIVGYVVIGPVLLTPADPLLTDKIVERLASFHISEQTVRRAAALIPLVEPNRLKQTIDLLGELLSASSANLDTALQNEGTGARQEAAVSVPSNAGPRGLRRSVDDRSIKERFVLAKLRLGNAAETHQDIRELVLRKAAWHSNLDVERAAALETLSAVWRIALEETNGTGRPRARDFGLTELFKAQSVSAVLDWVAGAARCVAAPIPPEAKSALKSVRKYVCRSIAEKLSCAEVARATGMDSGDLRSMVQHHLGISFKQYLVMERLTAARRLLRESKMTATEIAAQTGFSDQSNFTKIFQKHERITPIQYRKNWVQSSKLIESEKP
jgi:AraC-like DNA-binding protein/ligand-binding sensor protein